MNEPVPTSRRDFERAMQQLFEEVERAKNSPGSYQSESSTRCYDCMFTTNSVDCYQCTYCDACEGCSSCTHCTRCENCHDSSYCIDSVNCSGCSYVVHSRDCFDCVFCFGCVGLVKKEFHILNQRYSRDEYFRVLEKLTAAFGLKK